MMYRNAIQDLMHWLNREGHKPMIIRGARQVGKTFLVREVAKRNHLQLVELNFEKQPELASLFNINNPQIILDRIAAHFSIEIVPSTTLLFLDEIQVVPELIAKLRWFAEDMPSLPVCAAGSLLEFALEDFKYSMPVGRVSYYYLEPLSFEEYLSSLGHDKLLEILQKFDFDQPLPEIIHQKCLEIFREYMLVGGMPAAVSTWKNERDIQRVSEVHAEIINSYRDDFAKYSGKLDLHYFHDIYRAIPKTLGHKCFYQKINPDVQSTPLKKAIRLLSMAQVCHKVQATHANGIPLAAEVNEKVFKLIFLDCGLCATALGIDLRNYLHNENIFLANEGGLSEQIVGQLLRTLTLYYRQHELFYWQREAKGSSAEIDYCWQYNTEIIPIEVKSGKTGSLKSLHMFMGIKSGQRAVRFNHDVPSNTPVEVKLYSKQTVSYHLMSLPFYLLQQLPRLLSLPQQS